MRYFTSDSHFCHARILELGRGRPFATIGHMNEALVANFSALIGPGDTLYHLGDVALGQWPLGLEYVKRIPGHKMLVPGNHDRVSSVEKLSRREKYLPDYIDAGFVVLDEIEGITIGGHEFLMSHYPYTGDSHDEDRFDGIRPVDNGMSLIHGHTHQSEVVSYSKHGALQISVGVDAWGFGPVSEEQILQVLRTEDIVLFNY